MKLFFKGDISDLEKGISILSDELKFSIDPSGVEVQVEKTGENKLQVAKKSGKATIRYNRKIHFFRALGLLVEAMREQEEFDISEEPQFTMNGAMFDVSQGNALITVENVKKLIRKMAVMGLNMLMLYSEDSFDLEGEPYFGYMRSRYSREELKECDNYADIFGIEMIPCVQTLAHLIDVLKWDCYSDIKEDDDTLLVGCDKTYEFIEKIIAEAASVFKTRRIHIGMDEAWKLGQGNYLLLNGYKKKFDIMTEHLNRVLKIVEKYGLKPMIWSDMYFREDKPGGHYYDRDYIIPESVYASAPKNMELVYWDYEHESKDFYKEWIRRHRLFGTGVIFAGGIWSWNGFAADYDKTFVTTNAALDTCKEEGVKEVFVTVWGDGGTESNVFINLLGMQLYAEHGYARKLDLEKLKKRFKFCTGGDYDSFMDITYLDKLYGMGTVEGWHYTNASRYLLWQDIMAGLFDKNIEGLGMSAHYAKMRKKMEQYRDYNGEWGYIFEFLGKLCSVLEIKADLGLEITGAYREKNLDRLRSIAQNELPELLNRVRDLRLYHRNLWYRTYKPFGWEIIDLRYGGLINRIDSAIDRILGFLEGRYKKLEELEEKRLYYYKDTPGLIPCNSFARMYSASRLSH